MDVGQIFGGIVLLVIAWVIWTYLPMLPEFLRVILAAVIALLGLYLIVTAVLEEEADAHDKGALTVAQARSVTHKIAHKAGSHGAISCKRRSSLKVDCTFTVRRGAGHVDDAYGHPAVVVESCRYVSHVVKSGRRVVGRAHPVSCVQ